MLRRISLFAASAAMLVLSALPASAATMQSSTHKLSFPALHGVSAWGNYTRTAHSVRITACAVDNARGVFAVGAVALVSNASNTRHTNIGAVSIGYHQGVCRTMILHYTAHLRVYTFIGSNRGTIVKRSAIRTIY